MVRSPVVSRPGAPGSPAAMAPALSPPLPAPSRARVLRPARRVGGPCPCFRSYVAGFPTCAIGAPLTRASTRPRGRAPYCGCWRTSAVRWSGCPVASRRGARFRRPAPPEGRGAGRVCAAVPLVGNGARPGRERRPGDSPSNGCGGPTPGAARARLSARLWSGRGAARRAPGGTAAAGAESSGSRGGVPLGHGPEPWRDPCRARRRHATWFLPPLGCMNGANAGIARCSAVSAPRRASAGWFSSRRPQNQFRTLQSHEGEGS
ncbi:hypothetical protein FHX37_1249 [Haloactinospora alba]|uniref:Uncharacterized protein n=1 Tax=Haloactinospora alba TaxID=405555 RepID=A0A543NHM3_9ACTN|nr:hypothetical protein FHX37_1249 [Haloactinospora alba]